MATNLNNETFPLLDEATAFVRMMDPYIVARAFVTITGMYMCKALRTLEPEERQLMMRNLISVLNVCPIEVTELLGDVLVKTKESENV